MRSLVRSSLATLIVGGLLIAGAAGAASAAPIVDSPWAKLPNTTKVPAMTTDSGGALYALTRTGAVMRIAPDGTVDTAWAATGSTNGQDIVALPDGSIMTANGKSNSVTRIDSTGKTKTIDLPLGEPVALTSLAGSVYTANAGTAAVAKIDPATQTVVNATFASLSYAPTKIEASATALYALENYFIAKIGADASMNEKFIELPATSYITDLAVTSDGRVLVIDAMSRMIRIYDAQGKPAGTVPVTEGTIGLMVDGHDNVYATDYQKDEVYWMPKGTSELRKVASMGGSDPVHPSTLAVSTSGVLFAAGYDTARVGRVVLVPTVSSAPLSTTLEVGIRFSAQVSSSGGVDPVTMTAESLPSWLSFDPATGILSGTPTEPGEYAFTISATNAAGSSPAQAAKIIVIPAVAPSPSPSTSPSTGGISGSSPGGSATASTGTAGGTRTLASTGSDAAPIGIAGIVVLGLGLAAFAVRRSTRRA